MNSKFNKVGILHNQHTTSYLLMCPEFTCHASAESNDFLKFVTVNPAHFSACTCHAWIAHISQLSTYFHKVTLGQCVHTYWQYVCPLRWFKSANHHFALMACQHSVNIRKLWDVRFQLRNPKLTLGRPMVIPKHLLDMC